MIIALGAVTLALIGVLSIAIRAHARVSSLTARHNQLSDDVLAYVRSLSRYSAHEEDLKLHSHVSALRSDVERANQVTTQHALILEDIRTELLRRRLEK